MTCSWQWMLTHLVMFSDLSSSVLEIDDSPKYDLKTAAVRAAGSKSPAEKTMDSNNGEKIFLNIFPR